MELLIITSLFTYNNYYYILHAILHISQYLFMYSIIETKISKKEATEDFFYIFNW